LIHICIHASLCLVWKKQTMNVQSYWTPQKGKVNNKQNDLKQEFLFLKDPPLNLRESGSKYGHFEPTTISSPYTVLKNSTILRLYGKSVTTRKIRFLVIMCSLKFYKVQVTTINLCSTKRLLA